MARARSDTLELQPEPKRFAPQEPQSVARPSNFTSEIMPGNRATEEMAVRGGLIIAGDQPEVGPAPRPCERCVRTGKTCRGVANARCEYCKRLKQKCSNSTGPARGKHAAAARLAQGGAAPVRVPLVPQARPSDPSVSAPSFLGQKRRLDDRADGPSNRAAPGISRAPEEEESDDDHDLPARLNKRRRTAMSGAIIASRVLRHVRDLEATVKRLEDVYATEMQRVEDIISHLMKDMESLTGDSEREASL
ncbi:hypothetical protein H1R20_g3428, partial [Candolleomyces eurysporus]